MEEIRLYFTGDYKGLKKQLKIWCAKESKPMNATVLELIKKHLKNK